MGYSCDTRELAMASTCQWREDVDAGICWELKNVTVGCDSAAGLVVSNMFSLTLSFKVQRHVLKTVCDGAAFHEAVCTRKIAWMGYVTFSWFCVLCVCVHDESNLVSLQNQGADFVNAVWVLSKCIAQENFNTLDNICSLHICLHMPWWSVVATCLATTIFLRPLQFAENADSQVLFDSNRFHCGQADSSSSESACAVFECNVDVVVLWFCHIQMWLVCLVPFLKWNHWKSLVRIHLHMRWTVFEQSRNWD